MDGQFACLASAIIETWRNCGMMKTVIVCSSACASIEKFAETFSPWVEIQIEPLLVPGDIDSMSRDCNGHLCDRFSTEFTLIVQNDGFPLKPGLESFLGPWDFIGAPYVRMRWPQQLFCKITGAWVSNGGFSLRSHEICDQAAWYWRRKYAGVLQGRWVAEDLYYTQFLPFHERTYRREIRIADTQSALRFSYDAIVPMQLAELPFGFHRATTFAQISNLMNARGENGHGQIDSV